MVGSTVQAVKSTPTPITPCPDIPLSDRALVTVFSKAVSQSAGFDYSVYLMPKGADHASERMSRNCLVELSSFNIENFVS